MTITLTIINTTPDLHCTCALVTLGRKERRETKDADIADGSQFKFTRIIKSPSKLVFSLKKTLKKKMEKEYKSLRRESG